MNNRQLSLDFTANLKWNQHLIAALRINEPSAEIIHEDAIEIISKVLNQVLRSSYLGVIKHAPKIWGEYYYRTQEISEDSLLQRFLKKRITLNI